MKISCQSCEAKYTIADEKVRGKVVKIRCKKCGATIVVKGTELSAPVNADYDDAPTRVLDRDELPPIGGRPSGEWTLNVTDDDQRTVATEELVALYRSGTIDADTYAWRDGMDDWLPLGEIEELRDSLLKQARASVATPPANPPPPPSSSRAAVRRPEAGRSSTDLFGAAAFAGSDADVMTSAGSAPTAAAESPHLTGARNESSVLFSLSALTGGTSPTKLTAHDDSSSIVDIKNLMGPSPGARQAAPASKVEDIMNLGGGGIFSASLAAPVLESSPPDAASPVGGSRSDSPKGNKGLIFGALGVAAIALLGTGAFLAFGRGGESPAPVAEVNAAGLAASNPTSAAPSTPAAADEKSAPVAEVAPNAQASDPSAPVEPEKTAAAPAQAEVQPAVAREKERAPAPAKATEKQQPAKTIAAAAKPAPPPPKPAAPAPSEAPPFDRAAALSSLNAASDAAASACKKPGGPTGSGRIAVTFAPTGVVTTANVEGPPFAGTAVGGCVAARFRSARVPAFAGGMVTVRKSFTIN